MPWSEEPDESALSATLPFVLDDIPSRVTDRSATRALEVVQVFGDAVVEVRHLVAGETLVLGRDLDVPVEFQGPLAHHDGAGWVVGTRGKARLVHGDDAGEVHAVEVTLAEDDQLVLELGAVTLVLREVWRSRRLPVPVGQDVDLPFVALTGALGLLVALSGWVATFLPDSRPVATVDPWVARVTQMYLQPPPPPLVAPGKAGAGKAGGAAPAAGPHHVDVAGRPAGKPDPVGILGALDDTALKAILGDANLPGDIQRGIADMHGGITTDLGAHGLGGRCIGPDCTGLGATTGEGVGDIGTHGRSTGYGRDGGQIDRSPPPEIHLHSEELITFGAVNASDIDRVVKEHMRQIRYCYQRELQRSPDLAGKIKVKFVIAADGSVSSSLASVTTLNNPGAEGCVTQEFMRMRFPAPKGGGIAIISYPLLFSPG